MSVGIYNCFLSEQSFMELGFSCSVIVIFPSSINRSFLPLNTLFLVTCRVHINDYVIIYYSNHVVTVLAFSLVESHQAIENRRFNKYEIF